MERYKMSSNSKKTDINHKKPHPERDGVITIDWFF